MKKSISFLGSTRWIGLGWAWSTATASAHPGHALLDHGSGHAWQSPDHLVMLAGIGCLLLAAGQLAAKASLKQKLRWAGAATWATAFLTWS
jgi:hypothetical protein